MQRQAPTRYIAMRKQCGWRCNMAVRHYKATLTVEGLVHIGDGEKYGKKDYFAKDGKIAILDAARFIQRLDPAQLEEYCEFLREDSRFGLQDYLDTHRELEKAAKSSVAYTIDSSLARARRGSYQYFDVYRFMKDAYGCPYVPGSSVKGMLRTALFTFVILNSKGICRRLYEEKLSSVGDPGKAGEMLSQQVFQRNSDGKFDSGIVNDIMRYVSVSDSAPLTTEDLVFAKKYDKFSIRDDGRHKKQMGRISDGSYYEGNELNIYRECLKPGTRIEVLIDIDERMEERLRIVKLDLDGLAEIFAKSFELYERSFLQHFEPEAGNVGAGSSAADDGRCRYVAQEGPFPGMRCRNASIGGTGYCITHQDKIPAQNDPSSGADKATCYLGGGVDFDSKTILNALYDGDDQTRVREIANILYGQFTTWVDPANHTILRSSIRSKGFEPKIGQAKYKRNGRLSKAKEDHRHWMDPDFGVSPHTMKYGIVGKEKHPMGKCSIVFTELR
ncbi:type III-A CRISPR-associated RAMP protein Csm5 [Eggerthellaceae bacterium zg-887]|nr:type III-A CRISPR-associated RAMP protein Csm5 [Xiamenia xianingshaonis]